MSASPPRVGVAEAALWLLAAGLAAAAVAWPDWRHGRASAETREAAEATLARLAERQRALAAEGRPYAAFGPSVAERRAALPSHDPGTGTGGDLFDVDALLYGDGTLRLRAVSRPDAIREGRATPVALGLDLAPRDGARQDR